MAGDGGLIAGIAAWYASRIVIVGVEPSAAPCSVAPILPGLGGTGADRGVLIGEEQRDRYHTLCAGAFRVRTNH